MLLAALRRLAAVIAGALAGAGLLGLIVAGLTHEHVQRSLTVGLYVVGVGLAGLGFLISAFDRPVRSKGGGGFVGLGRWMGGGVRWATREEHRQAINLPALLVTVGILLIAIGFAVDPRR